LPRLITLDFENGPELLHTDGAIRVALTARHCVALCEHVLDSGHQVSSVWMGDLNGLDIRGYGHCPGGARNRPGRRWVCDAIVTAGCSSGRLRGLQTLDRLGMLQP
jgi:hypothetical protein